MTNQEQATIAHAVPIQSTIRVIPSEVNEPPLNIKKTFSYSKSVQLFAIIEAFFLILFGFYQPWYFLQAIGPICGYVGAKKFNVYLSYFYFSYLIVAFLSKIVILSLTLPNPDSFFIFLSFFTLFIDIWILKISHSFLHYLQGLTADERNNLRHMKIITTYHYW